MSRKDEILTVKHQMNTHVLAEWNLWSRSKSFSHDSWKQKLSSSQVVGRQFIEYYRRRVGLWTKLQHFVTFMIFLEFPFLQVQAIEGECHEVMERADYEMISPENGVQLSKFQKWFYHNSEACAHRKRWFTDWFGRRLWPWFFYAVASKCPFHNVLGLC